MASLDCEGRFGYRPGPRSDSLGLSFFFFHLLVSAYVLLGWIVSSKPPLLFYLLLLPFLAVQWRLNQGCCVINNLESWLRTGRWRDPNNREEGAFLLMLCDWFLGIRPHPLILDRFSYAAVLGLWLLALSHFSWLSAS